MCSLCNQEAIVRVDLDHGCAAFPDLKVQDLCMQHASSIEPIGEIEVAEVYRQDLLDFVRGDRR